MGKPELEFLKDTVSALVDQITVFDQSMQVERPKSKNQQLSVLVFNIKSVLNAADVENDLDNENEGLETNLLKLLKAVEQQVSAFEHFSEGNVRIRVLCKNIRLIFNERRQQLRTIKKHNKYPEYMQSEVERMKEAVLGIQNEHGSQRVKIPQTFSDPYKGIPVVDPSIISNNDPTHLPETESKKKNNPLSLAEELIVLTANTCRKPRIFRDELMEDFITILKRHDPPDYFHNTEGDTVKSNKINAVNDSISSSKNVDVNGESLESKSVKRMQKVTSQPPPEIKVNSKDNSLRTTVKENRNTSEVISSKKTRDVSKKKQDNEIISDATAEIETSFDSDSGSDSDLAALLRQVLTDEGHGENFIQKVLTDRKKMKVIKKIIKEEVNYVLEIESSAQMLNELIPGISKIKKVSSSNFKKVIAGLYNHMISRSYQPFGTKIPATFSGKIVSAATALTNECERDQSSHKQPVPNIPKNAETGRGQSSSSNIGAVPIATAGPSASWKSPVSSLSNNDNFPYPSRGGCSSDQQGGVRESCKQAHASDASWPSRYQNPCNSDEVRVQTEINPNPTDYISASTSSSHSRPVRNEQQCNNDVNRSFSHRRFDGFFPWSQSRHHSQSQSQRQHPYQSRDDNYYYRHKDSSCKWGYDSRSNSHRLGSGLSAHSGYGFNSGSKFRSGRGQIHSGQGQGQDVHGTNYNHNHRAYGSGNVNVPNNRGTNVQRQRHVNFQN